MMRRADGLKALRSHTLRWRREGRRVAFVPTMGNLHEGHVELVRVARQHADRVVASIYVNPTQFGEGEDLARYPRTLEADCLKLEAANCDLVFLPDNETMYPGGTEGATQVQAAPALADELEGAFRPGHFDGVVTVVARLFNMVEPDLAVFGEKDYQQLLVIQRMVRDLGYGIRILQVPTVREANGLALSSRNGYLDDEQKTAAATLNRILHEAGEKYLAGEGERVRIEQEASEELVSRGFRVDYVAIRRAEDLSPPGTDDKLLRVLAAAWCGKTRLIDNRPLKKK